jgi:hypothetical protein
VEVTISGASERPAVGWIAWLDVTVEIIVMDVLEPKENRNYNVHKERQVAECEDTHKSTKPKGRRGL